MEETNETGGLTRSGRCYVPEELRRPKQLNDSQGPIKKLVTDEEAEEFLKKQEKENPRLFHCLSIEKNPSSNLIIIPAATF